MHHFFKIKHLIYNRNRLTDRVEIELALVAKITGPPFPADALKRIDQIHTGSSIHARSSATVINVLMAVKSCIPWITNTSSSTASASTTAWSSFTPASKTFISYSKLKVMCRLIGTILSLPLSWTVTVIVCLGVKTWSGVSAWIRVAMVSVNLTLVPGISNWTNTFIGVHQVSTFTSIPTRLRGTLVNINFTILS